MVSIILLINLKICQYLVKQVIAAKVVIIFQFTFNVLSLILVVKLVFFFILVAKESNGVKVAQSYDEIKAIRGSNKEGIVCKQAKKGKELSKLKQTTASIKEEIDELATDKDSLLEENDNLKEELKCQKEEIAYLCEQIGEMRNRLKGASAEMNSLEKLATQLELLNVSTEKERVANKERFKEDFELMKRQFDDRYQLLCSRLEAKRNQRAKMQLRYNQSKMKNLQIKQQTELMKVQLEGRLAEATRKSQDLATLKKQLNERHAKEKAGIEKLKQDVKLATSKKDALEIETSRLGDIEAKSKALAEKLDNRKGQFQEAKQRNQELLATVEKRTNRINELQSVNATKSAEMENLNELCKQREEKVDQLKTLLANQQQQAEQLDAVKTELIAESDTLSLQVAELSLEFDQRTSDKVSLTSNLAVLRQDKDEQSRAIEDAQAELEQNLADARILNEQSVNSNALAAEKSEQYLESEKENFSLTTDICKMYFANKAGKKELDSLVRETVMHPLLSMLFSFFSNLITHLCLGNC